MQNDHQSPVCPLCLQEQSSPFFSDRSRSYLCCAVCQLIFVPRQFWLSNEAEKAEYDLHENDPRDPGYRKFLTRLATPLTERLAPGKKGLDFGCGEGSALPLLLTEQGHQVAQFDIYYHNRPELLEQSYDFICATEVVEHLRCPHSEFLRLFSILKPGGWLGIMTKLAHDRQAFGNWHYIRDLTHICFYTRETFTWLAQKYQADLEFVADDVILLQKSEG